MAAAAIFKKNEKSPYLVKGSTDFDQIWHGDAVQHFWAVRPLKIWNLKIQDGGGRHLEKSKNRYISAAFWPILTKFGMATLFDPSDASDS